MRVLNTSRYNLQFKIQLAILPLRSTATLQISQGHQNIHVRTGEVRKVIIMLAVGAAFQREKDRSSSVFKIKETQEDFSLHKKLRCIFLHF